MEKYTEPIPIPIKECQKELGGYLEKFIKNRRRIAWTFGVDKIIIAHDRDDDGNLLDEIIYWVEKDGQNYKAYNVKEILKC